MTEQKDQKKDTAKESSPAKKTKLKGKSKKKDKANNKEITQLKEQISSEKDRVLRLSAEFENFQKRKQRFISNLKHRIQIYSAMRLAAHQEMNSSSVFNPMKACIL